MIMMNTLRRSALVLCLSVAAFVNAADIDSISSHGVIHRIGADVRPGYVVPVKSFYSGNNALGRPIDFALSGHLKYSFRFASDTYFGRMFPHTYQGIGVGVHSFFDKEELGTPVSVYAFQGSRIARLSRNLSFDYEWNFGASFGWKKYNKETNSFNDIVGSKINAFINLGFMLNWQMASDWSLTCGVDLTHFSNGNTNYPNVGVNTVGARVGVVRTFSAGSASERDVIGTSVRAQRIRPHLSCDVVAYGSRRKRSVVTDYEGFMVPGSFGVAGVNINPMYNFCNVFCAGASLDVQYDESSDIKDHMAKDADVPQGSETKFFRPPFKDQVSAGVSLRAELVMPIFSINFGVGHSVYCKGKDQRGFYQVLALKTYVSRNMFLHVGYMLERFNDPSNLMLGIGYRFHNKRYK